MFLVDMCYVLVDLGYYRYMAQKFPWNSLWSNVRLCFILEPYRYEGFLASRYKTAEKILRTNFTSWADCHFWTERVKIQSNVNCDEDQWRLHFAVFVFFERSTEHCIFHTTLCKSSSCYLWKNKMSDGARDFNSLGDQVSKTEALNFTCLVVCPMTQ